MSDPQDDRIAKLSKRFSERGQSEKQSARSNKDNPLGNGPQRKRRTYYLDQTLIKRLDQAYPKFMNDLYPMVKDKASYLETLLEFSLEHLEDIKADLTKNQKPD